MKSLLFILTVLSLEAFGQGKIELEGKYSDDKKELYFQNPYAHNSNTIFCIDSITVNGKRSTINVDAPAFKLPLDNLGFMPGQELMVIVYYKRNCKPKVLMQGHPSPH